MRTQRRSGMQFATTAVACGLLLEPALLHSQNSAIPAAERRDLQAADAAVRDARNWPRALIATTGQIASTPEAYYGKRVNVQATVEHVLGPTLFTLDEDAWLAGPDVVVHVEPPEALTVAERSRVTVIGVVRDRLVPEVALDPGWTSPPMAHLELHRRPVIEADGVRLPGGPWWSREPGAAFLMETSPGQIAATPSRFYDQFVRVEAEVDQVWNPHTFSLDEDRLFVAADLLVLNPAPRDPARPDQRVTVVGRVRPLIERELDRDVEWFESDMIHESLRSVFDNRPVVLAHSVQLEGGEELVARGR